MVYTWHHMDNLDGDLECTMQLVDTEAHEATLLHIGSHAQFHKTIYGTDVIED